MPAEKDKTLVLLDIDTISSNKGLAGRLDAVVNPDAAGLWYLVNGKDGPGMKAGKQVADILSDLIHIGRETTKTYSTTVASFFSFVSRFKTLFWWAAMSSATSAVHPVW